MKFSSILLALSVTAVIGIGVLRAVTFEGNCGVSNTSTDGESFSFAGSANLENKTIPSLYGSGSARLDNVIVQGEAKISGSLKVQGGNFGSVNVSGSAVLVNTAVSGNTHIAGALDATNTTFTGIECTSNKIILSQCTADSIIIKAPKSCTKPLIVELEGTIVSGDITFVGAKGQINLQDGATVKGQIINGTMINN